MHSDKLRKNIKLAALIILMSLISFMLGARFGNKPLLFSPEVAPAIKKPQDIRVDGNLLLPIVEVVHLIQEKYVGEVDGNALIEGAIRGMVDSLEDPYSLYMNSKDFEDFMITIEGSFSGVGIYLSVDEKGDVVVISPVEDSPAYHAGILPRDRIVGVDDVYIADKSLDEIVGYIRGERGTQVILHIEREGEDELKSFELIREDIRQRTVKHELLSSKVGYVKITSFDSFTHADFSKAVSTLKEEGMEAMVLDLRNNPGGSLQECVMVADEILGEGLIVYTEDRNNNRLEEYFSDERGLEMPLAVLINENSASASEIVAGAIQDHEAGVLVGQKTFGKGSVQELEPFEGGGGIKITIAKYYIPSGRSIDGIGIEPDIEVEMGMGFSIFDVPLEEDPQFNKAIEALDTKIEKSR